ncbi:transmembrane cell adhesion receptor mua-3-like [Emydura macquarii macquarii]|uniref:transmembrane cell adhesion receptor mua-3-like n=1 Tax=Emydura macquarii macquarii TaxID=1129001 RepID=UPI00352A0C24
MRIVIKSLRSGSIIVDFYIIVDVGENITKTELSNTFTEVFTNSSVFQVDHNATFIEETNSCETGLNGCSGNASCNVSGPSYTCRCQDGFTDFSPSVPGRDCRAKPDVEPVTIAPSRQSSTSKSSVKSTSPTPESETAPAASIKTTVSLPMPSPNSTSLIYPTTVNATTLMTSSITITLHTTTEVTSLNTVSKVTTSNIIPTSPTGNTITTSTAIARNSCEGGNGCSPHAICTPIGANYTCKCKDGFKDHRPNVPGRDCQDIDECAANTSSCSYLATCTNTVGSYDCACNPGIKDENSTNPGRQCKDPLLCFNSTEFCTLQNNDCPVSKDLICSSKQVFDCKILFKEFVFVPELYNSSSEKYQNLSKRITIDVVEKMRIKLGDDSFDIIMVGFRPGSVIAYFVSLIQGQQSIGANTLQASLSEIVKAMFGNQTEVTVQSRNSCEGGNGCSPNALCTPIGANYTCKCKDGFEDRSPNVPGRDCQASETNLAWKTAVIVLGVLFGVALLIVLLILAVCLWMKHTSGKYWVEPKGLMGNFAYQYL